MKKANKIIALILAVALAAAMLCTTISTLASSVSLPDTYSADLHAEAGANGGEVHIYGKVVNLREGPSPVLVRVRVGDQGGGNYNDFLLETHQVNVKGYEGMGLDDIVHTNYNGGARTVWCVAPKQAGGNMSDMDYCVTVDEARENFYKDGMDMTDVKEELLWAAGGIGVGSGNPVNDLKMLNVDGALIDGFAADKTEYSMDVSSDKTAIDLSAMTVNPNLELSIYNTTGSEKKISQDQTFKDVMGGNDSGVFPASGFDTADFLAEANGAALAAGKNTFEFRITPRSGNPGEEKTYTLTVNREGSEGDNGKDDENTAKKIEDLFEGKKDITVFNDFSDSSYDSWAPTPGGFPGTFVAGHSADLAIVDGKVVLSKMQQNENVAHIALSDNAFNKNYELIKYSEGIGWYFENNSTRAVEIGFYGVGVMQIDTVSANFVALDMYTGETYTSTGTAKISIPEGFKGWVAQSWEGMVHLNGSSNPQVDPTGMEVDSVGWKMEKGQFIGANPNAYYVFDDYFYYGDELPELSDDDGSDNGNGNGDDSNTPATDGDDGDDNEFYGGDSDKGDDGDGSDGGDEGGDDYDDNNSDIAQTGEKFDLFMIIALMIAGLSVAIMIIVKRKRIN